MSLKIINPKLMDVYTPDWANLTNFCSCIMGEPNKNRQHVKQIVRFGVKFVWEKIGQNQSCQKKQRVVWDTKRANHSTSPPKTETVFLLDMTKCAIRRKPSWSYMVVSQIVGLLLKILRRNIHMYETINLKWYCLTKYHLIDGSSYLVSTKPPGVVPSSTTRK